MTGRTSRNQNIWYCFKQSLIFEKITILLKNNLGKKLILFSCDFNIFDMAILDAQNISIMAKCDYHNIHTVTLNKADNVLLLQCAKSANTLFSQQLRSVTSLPINTCLFMGHGSFLRCMHFVTY